jgi:hypothetical protein
MPVTELLLPVTLVAKVFDGISPDALAPDDSK